MASSLFAGGLAGFLGIFGFGGHPEPRNVEPRPVSAPVVASSASAVRGTMVVIHGGAWRGPDAEHQQRLVREPGQVLVQRGWRVVSVDYKEGQPGLQDVLDVIGQELLKPSGRLLCLYGESAGGQLALVAAARLAASVDCVVAAGVPTDFQAYFARAAAGGDDSQQYVADTIRKVFGDTPEATAPWDPVRLAGAIDADVLLAHQIGDPLIPTEQVERFRALRPTTQAVELEAGDPANPDEQWVHGALSTNGRNNLISSVGSFVDRAAAAHSTARKAGRTRCPSVNRRIARVGTARFRQGLRCLARRDGRGARGKRNPRSSPKTRRRTPKTKRHAAKTSRSTTTTTRMLGEVTAARAWAALRGTRGGRRQLTALAAGRATASVRSGDPSLLVVRSRSAKPRK